MSGWKKLAAASAAGGGGLDITDVFSTYLYEGNGSTRTITNGIDLSGEGGLVWIKNRESGSYNNHFLSDTENGANNFLATNQTNGLRTLSNFGLTAFNSDGFDMGIAYGNESGKDIASWTFRKAPKFFDVVTWTGTGNVTTNIPHSLGSVPASIHVKATSTSGSWAVVHRTHTANSGAYQYVRGSNNPSNFGLNSTGIPSQSGPEGNITATHFDPRSCGNAFHVNAQGVSYVAYLFAHNDGDGEFGPDADQDIIKCGSVSMVSGFTDVNLGFEPQFVIIKSLSGSQDWFIQDSMRGLPYEGYNLLYANRTDGEFSNTSNTPVRLTPTGMKVNANYFGAGDFAYIAIRRGSLFPPESATEVFDVTTYTGSSDFSSFSGLSTNYVDATANFIRSGYGAGTLIWSRLAGSNSLKTWSRAAEGDTTDTVQWDFTDNKLTITGGSTGSGGSTYVNYFWKRAPGFFDVVAYTGDGTTARAIPHNLGVAPEMMMHKRRDGINDWYVPDFINSKLLLLNYNLSAFDTSLLANYYGSGNGSSGGAGSLVTPDASTFTVTPNPNVNASGGTYIAYLFASLPGISKVGSYTGNGSSQTINCGFTSGARFILIKRTDSTGDWYVWDTERGIVAGNDPYLELNTSDPEVTNRNWVNPDNSGFIVSSTINVSSASYIFYAIA